MMLYEAVARLKVVYMKQGLTEVIVPDCQILGNGTAPESKGILIADNNRFWYIPLVTENLKDALTKMQDICDKMKAITDNLGNASTLLDNASVVTGAAALTPSVVTGTTMANTASGTGTEIDALKREIQTLASQIV